MIVENGSRDEFMTYFSLASRQINIYPLRLYIKRFRRIGGGGLRKSESLTAAIIIALKSLKNLMIIVKRAMGTAINPAYDVQRIL